MNSIIDNILFRRVRVFVGIMLLNFNKPICETSICKYRKKRSFEKWWFF